MKKNTLRIICMLFICNMVILSNLNAQTAEQADVNEQDNYKAASYKGGSDALKKYFEKNISFSTKKKSEIFLGFNIMIDTDGMASIIRYTNWDADYQLKRHVKEVVLDMTEWIPAQNDDGPIESTLSVEIVYEMNEMKRVSYDTQWTLRKIDLDEPKVLLTDFPKYDEKPFVTAEQMPNYPGGEKEMMNFIASNLQYPETAKEQGIEGRIVVRFVVNKKGNITDIRLIRGLNKECDEEAMRIVRAMPAWEPARQNERPVPVYFTLPFIFRLNKQESSVE